MSKKLSVLFVSAVLLVACQKQGTATDTGNSVSSQPAMEQASSDAAMPSADTDAAVWAMVGTWSPDIAWSAPKTGTNSTEIRIDADHTIPEGMMQTNDVMATMTAADYAKTFIEGRAALTTAAQADGWMPMLSMDADGPTGTVWAYKKDTPDGTRFLVFMGAGTDCSDSKDTPTQCANFQTKVSVTPALGEGDDL